MAISPALAALVGRWSGDNAVWLEPGADPFRSSASAEVSLEAEGQALCMRYVWAEGGKPQSGVLLLVGDATLTAWLGSWTDSWHLAHQLMDLRGTGDGSSVSVRGTYAAPTRHPRDPIGGGASRSSRTAPIAARCACSTSRPTVRRRWQWRRGSRASREHGLPGPRHRDYNWPDALVNRTRPPALGDA